MELLRQRRQSTPSVTQGPEREDHLMRPITTRAEELPGRVDRTGSERPRGCYVARDRFFDGDGLRQDVLFACDDLLPLRTEREPQLDDLNSGLEQRQNLKVDIHEWRSLLVAAWIPARPVLGIQRKVLRLVQCRYGIEDVVHVLVRRHGAAADAAPQGEHRRHRRNRRPDARRIDRRVLRHGKIGGDLHSPTVEEIAVGSATAAVLRQFPIVCDRKGYGIA